jgi:hypothetical protein
MKLIVNFNNYLIFKTQKLKMIVKNQRVFLVKFVII